MFCTHEYASRTQVSREWNHLKMQTLENGVRKDGVNAKRLKMVVMLGAGLLACGIAYSYHFRVKRVKRSENGRVEAKHSLALDETTNSRKRNF